VTTKNLGFDGADVWTIAFQPGSIRLWFGEGGTYLEVSGVWDLAWPDGSTSEYDTDSAGRHPDTARLIESLAEAHVVTAVADTETSVLDVEFDSGLKLHYEPTDSPYEEWQARNRDDRTYVCLTTNRLTWFPADSESSAADEAAPEEVAWYEGSAPRVVDLEISDRIYGVTVHAESVQLETWTGTIFFAGPFTITDEAGEPHRFDPKLKASDPHTGEVLELLIDSQIETAALTAETSELDVSFTDGKRLTWAAAAKGQGHFMARHKNGRQYWSASDGGVFWYGGPKGTHPTFLVGGPKKTDRTD